MKTVMIFGHNNMEGSRVSRLILNLAKEKGIPSQVLSELHQNYEFDILAEQEVLSKADRIVMVYPTQWYNMPFLMKKWVDDVFTGGWCYDGGEALKGKELVVITHCAGPQAVYRVGASNLQPRENYLMDWMGLAGFCGMKFLPGSTLFGVHGQNDDQLKAKANEVLDSVQKVPYWNPLV